MAQYLSSIFTNQSTIEFLIALSSSMVIGSVICITYAFSHSRAIYSKSFNMALMMFTMLSAMSICIVSRNLKLAIGAVGALSIVRFRNVVKDHRDLLFILWSVIAGLSSGLSEYLIAGIGSLIVFGIIVLFGCAHNGERVIMVVRGKGQLESIIMEVTNRVLNGKAKLKVNNSTNDVTELIFQLPKLDIKYRRSACRKIKENLYNNIDEIETINFISQAEELGV